jgi:hypothetical protein
VLSLAVVAALGLGGYLLWQLRAAQNELATRKLTLVDGAGTVRATLTAEGRTALLTLNDESGRPRVTLGGLRADDGLQLLDQKRQVLATLSPTSLDLYGVTEGAAAPGPSSVSLRVAAGSPSLELRDPTHEMSYRVALAATGMVTTSTCGGTTAQSSLDADSFHTSLEFPHDALRLDFSTLLGEPGTGSRGPLLSLGSWVGGSDRRSLLSILGREDGVVQLLLGERTGPGVEIITGLPDVPEGLVVHHTDHSSESFPPREPEQTAATSPPAPAEAVPEAPPALETAR